MNARVTYRVVQLRDYTCVRPLVVVYGALEERIGWAWLDRGVEGLRGGKGAGDSDVLGAMLVARDEALESGVIHE